MIFFNPNNNNNSNNNNNDDNNSNINNSPLRRAKIMQLPSHDYAKVCFAILQSAFFFLRGSNTKRRTVNIQENDLSKEKDFLSIFFIRVQ